MTIVRATLIAHRHPDWPIPVMSESIPLGKVYRIDLDSERLAVLGNRDHPEWGTLDVLAVLDVDEGHPLPVCCLRIES